MTDQQEVTPLWSDSRIQVQRVSLGYRDHKVMLMMRDDYEAARRQVAAEVEALREQVDSLTRQLGEARIDGQYWHDMYLSGGEAHDNE